MTNRRSFIQSLLMVFVPSSPGDLIRYRPLTRRVFGLSFGAEDSGMSADGDSGGEDGDPVYPISGPVIGARSFISTHFTGHIWGISGYRPTGNVQPNGDPTAPWNSGPIYKWAQRTISGCMSQAYYFGAGCTGGAGFNSTILRQYSGSLLLNDAGIITQALEEECTIPSTSGPTDCVGCVPFSSSPVNTNPWRTAVGCGGGSDTGSADTLTQSITVGCGCVGQNNTLGNVTEQLAQPVSLIDAVVDSIISVGTVAYNDVISVAVTDPESLIDMLVELRRVAYSFDITELQPGTCYSVTIPYVDAGNIQHASRVLIFEATSPSETVTGTVEYVAGLSLTVGTPVITVVICPP